MTKIAIAHRTGVVPVGEASVIIAVSSIHRKEALEARGGKRGMREREGRVCVARERFGEMRIFKSLFFRLFMGRGCQTIPPGEPG